MKLRTKEILLKIIDCKDFYQTLIKLEEAFHLRLLNKQHISELINKYANLIEYYDLIKDPIKQYFIDKMQFVLSRPESIRTICECVLENEKNHINLAQQFMPISKAPSLTEIIEKKQILLNLDRDQTTQQQRSMQLHLNLELLKEKKDKNHNTSVERLLNDYSVEQKKMDVIYQDEMKIQQEILQQKLKKRKNKLSSGFNTPQQKQKFSQILLEEEIKFN